MSCVLVNKIINTGFEGYDVMLSGKGKVYTFLNPVSYLDAIKDKKLFDRFDGIFADGSILVGAIKTLYGKNVNRFSFDMTSVAPKLFKYAADHRKTIYVVASRQEQVEKAAEILKQRYSELCFIGLRNGYFNNEEEIEDEVKKIVSANPDFLIVGMGIIKQEKFLLRAKDAGFQGIGFTCGGFIHQTAQDQIDYYPAWIDKYNLRFLYRMYKEPHTRKRYIKAGFIFPWKFVWERFFG